jgi:mannose-1-phosphate guanylyltransferase
MGWSDVGEWISLKEALEKNHEDVVTKGNVYTLNTKDSIIYNYEDDKFIATIGLDGFVIVNTPDVIAIFPKEDNTKLKELLKLLEDTPNKKYL